MKIAHVLDNLNVGGMERIVVDLAKQQKRSGHHVEVFTIYGEGALASELRQSGIAVRIFQKSSGLNLAFLLKLKKAFKVSAFDVVHTHNHSAAFYGGIAAGLAGVKAVVNTRHGMGNFYANARQNWIFWFSSLFLKSVVCVCEKAYERFKEVGAAPNSKMCVIYNGINLDKFVQINKDNYSAIRQEFHVPQEDKIIGIVARLDPAKDISTLIKAFKIVSEKIGNVRLMVVGDGKEKDKLKSVALELNIDQRIIFTGVRYDVERFLGAFDLFVLSSLSEGMSLTLIEAMAAGKPVIATDVGGNSEVVINGLTGTIIPPADPAVLADSILRYFAHPGLALTYADNARKRAISTFSIDRMAEAYEKVYTS